MIYQLKIPLGFFYSVIIQSTSSSGTLMIKATSFTDTLIVKDLF
jgi:hypothetical protein